MTAHCRIWLVRHARPQIDEGLCYGATDVSACPTDTERAAQSLTPVLPVHAQWRMSGLVRAQQLAHAVLRQRGVSAPLRVDERLNEMDFGCHEMQPWSAIDRAAFDAWESNFGGHRFGGRENVNSMLQRVAGALCEALSSGASDHVWFTHAGVIQSVKLYACQPLPAITMGQWPKADVPFGEWVCQTFALDALPRLSAYAKTPYQASASLA